MIIFRLIEWDMGHRITNHKSLCKNLHGHRYKAEIGITGKIIQTSGSSDQGMVLDFGNLKQLIKDEIDTPLDHSFMLWDKDDTLVEFFKRNPDLKYVLVPFPPTAENIAIWIYEKLNKRFSKEHKNKLKVEQVKLWETPNNLVLYKK